MENVVKGQRKGGHQILVGTPESVRYYLKEYHNNVNLKIFILDNADQVFDEKKKHFAHVQKIHQLLLRKR